MTSREALSQKVSYHFGIPVPTIIHTGSHRSHRKTGVTVVHRDIHKLDHQIRDRSVPSIRRRGLKVPSAVMGRGDHHSIHATGERPPDTKEPATLASGDRGESSLIGNRNSDKNAGIGRGDISKVMSRRDRECPHEGGGRDRGERESSKSSNVVSDRRIIKNMNRVEQDHNQRTQNGRRVKSNIERIMLPFKVAIMVHFYKNVDVNRRVLKSLIPFLNHYHEDSIHFYINIINSEVEDSLHESVVNTFSERNKNVTIYHNENRGGDIGSFLILLSKVLTSGIDFRYLMFFHTKSDHMWRTSLVKSLNTLYLERLDGFPDLGILGCRDHVYRCNYAKNNYQSHFKTIETTLDCEINLPSNDNYIHFIGGTIFLLNMDVVRWLDPERLIELYKRLNTVDTIDENWQKMATTLKKRTKDTNNDYHYRQLYGKSILSDYMIEHTFERFIGALVKKAGLKLYAV